jgi:site-specific recombinase XerD
VDTVFSSISWDEAVRDFILHLKAVRARKTVAFYVYELRVLSRWADAQDIPLSRFGKRHLDAFLVYRAEAGKSQTTLHHDAVSAKAFLKWCQKNDVVDRSLLADYEVRDAPKTSKYMPTSEDMAKLLGAIHTFWDPAKNPDARYSSLSKRVFHRDRNYAIVLTLLDSACRIGEVLSLKLDDYQASERQITITQSKGRDARSIPVSRDCAEAIAVWMKVRARVMKNVPKDQDEGWLFISETGGRIDEGLFLKTLKKFTAFAGATTKITLHSLRRYSLNRLAKHNLLAAQTLAGHKDTKTTLIYTKIDPDFVRQMHDEAGVVRGILNGKRAEKKRRLLS